MSDDIEEWTTPEERKPSIRSRGSSITSRVWNLLLEGAQKDIQTEIGFAEEKISRLILHRQIDLDPNFWSLDDDTVNLLKNGSPEELEREIELKRKWILEFKTKLSKANKMTRFMHSTRAVFHSAIDGFIRHMPMPDTHGSTHVINSLTEAIGDLLLRLEQTTIKNVELEMKLAALDLQIYGLQLGMKEINKRNEVSNVQPRLEAVELQNCMLNEFLSRIISDMKETSNGMKVLESGEPFQVRTTIREALILRRGVLEDCFPNLNAPGHSSSVFLWIPHDTSIHSTFTLQQLMEEYEPSNKMLPSVVEQLRHLKKSVKSLEETRSSVVEVKRKIMWNDWRKEENHYDKILRYEIPKTVEQISWKRSTSRSRRSTSRSIEVDGERISLTPYNQQSSLTEN